MFILASKSYQVLRNHSFEHKMFLPEMVVSVFLNYVSAAANHDSKKLERPSSTQGP